LKHPMVHQHGTDLNNTQTQLQLLAWISNERKRVHVKESCYTIIFFTRSFVACLSSRPPSVNHTFACPKIDFNSRIPTTVVNITTDNFEDFITHSFDVLIDCDLQKKHIINYKLFEIYSFLYKELTQCWSINRRPGWPGR
jgi:hypothetical protein